MACRAYNFSINTQTFKKCTTFFCADDGCMIRRNGFISQALIPAKNSICKMDIGTLCIYYKKLDAEANQFAYQTDMVRMIMCCQNVGKSLILISCSLIAL